MSFASLAPSSPASPASPASRLAPRAALVLTLSAIALQPVACKCEPEEITERTCVFAVETPDPNDTVAFRDTEVDDERNRSIRIVNTGNTVLETFSFEFAERNGQHYFMGEEAEDLRVEPNGSGTVRVFFKPLAESPNLGSVLTVSHNPVSGATCPAFAITLEGAGIRRVDPGDGGPDAGVDGGPDAGPDGGLPDGGLVDAGVVTPPDGGVILPPGARFSARGALQEARSGFATVVLDDATVLAIGGYGEDGQALTSIERFDPRTGTSRLVAHTSVPRAEPGAALLDDGRVVIAGGRTSAVDGLVVTTLEIYDPADDSVTCPPDQGACALQDIDQGRGVLPEGRIDPIVTAPPGGAPRVVVAFGRTVNDAGEEVPAAGGFVVPLTGALNASPLDGNDTVAARTGEVRVRGPDGAFLIAGGVSAAGAPLTDMGVFIPATDRLAPLGSTTPPRARVGGAGALLEGGDVVLAGGANAVGGPVAEMERVIDPFDLDGAVDPDVATVANISLMERRVGATLAALPGDLLLLAGGANRPAAELEPTQSVVPRQDADLFVPFGAGFLHVAPDNDLASPRFAHGAEVVTIPAEDDGAPEDIVLFLGGTSTTPRRTPHPQAERFRVERNEFEVYGLMGPGTAFAANAPADLYSLGGIDPHTGALSTRVRAFDTMNDAFGDRPPLDEPRRDHAVALLGDDNTFLVVGGRDATGQVLGTASLYNPFNAFDEPLSATLNRPRANPTATRLDDGAVLLCGGQGTGGEALDTCELFVPPPDLLNPNTYDEARFELVEGRMSTGRAGHTATLLEEEGEVLLVGGGDVETDLVRADLYDVAAQRITSTGLPNRARRGHVAVYLGSGRVLLAGGEIYEGGLATTDSAEVYERANGVFLPVDDPMGTPRVGAAGVRLEGGDVLIYGGARAGTGSFPTRSLWESELYQPGPTGVGEFVQSIDVPLSYGRSSLASTSEVFGRGVAAGGTHRDGRLSNGDERRTPLYFVDKLVNPGEEEPPPEPPTLDAGPADGG